MIVLDTNALMMPVECDVRVFEEIERVAGDHELVAPESVVTELRSLAEGASEEATAASVGLDLADRLSVVETDVAYADDAVLEIATDNGIDFAVTNDGPLKERLLARDVPVIGLRGQHKLAITQP
jgi:rRNA-processing protein FCF1